MTTQSPRWFKSSYSGSGGTCVEVAANLIATQGIVPVRDSKNPEGPRLDVEPSTWQTFVSFLKSHE